ncbi:chorismate--pyruvate lyase family protein [Thiomicrorhabdus arctica]|uniref:chorismate--pyruvate lyase family protein n=1 Tax=Thiomicrorhabdus arctica TaxID=131540 RepID=UPI00036A806A|nr:chorismate lyase [Thiomicrorhabdus arctica]
MPNERLAKIKALIQDKKTHTVRGCPSFWKPARLIQRVTSSSTIQSWLNTKVSLTQRLRQHCPTLQVLVLSEQTERPLLDETTALGLQPNDQAWVRCVLLQCANQNWVYARTVIPNLTPESPWSALQKLGNKPLGEVLFELPSIQRTPFEFTRQTLSSWPYLSEQLEAEQSQAKGYARRSIFTQKEAPLLLTEVFLPRLTGQ